MSNLNILAASTNGQTILEGFNPDLERLYTLEAEAKPLESAAKRFLDILIEIHDTKLYLGTHKSWKLYLKEKWGISRQYFSKLTHQDQRRQLELPPSPAKSKELKTSKGGKGGGSTEILATATPPTPLTQVQSPPPIVDEIVEEKPKVEEKPDQEILTPKPEKPKVITSIIENRASLVAGLKSLSIIEYVKVVAESMNNYNHTECKSIIHQIGIAKKVFRC